MQKFDVILSNAPYNNGLHVKFEAKYFELCKGQICWVSPLSFLLGKKQNKKLTVHLDKYATDIEQINGNEYFDAAIGGTMGIVHVDMSDKYLHYVKFDDKEYDKCDEISMISNDELLMEFKSIVEPLYKKDNLYTHLKSTPYAQFMKSHIDNNPNIDNYVMRTMAYSGQSSARSKEIGELYAFFSNGITIENNIGKYKDLIKKEVKSSKTGELKHWLEYYWDFEDRQTCINFYNYCKTFFARCSLYMSKTGIELVKDGSLKTVPWFDFSDSMFDNTPEEIDIVLFKKYNINQDIINHILEVLPNYYDLDLTKYKGQD